MGDNEKNKGNKYLLVIIALVVVILGLLIYLIVHAVNNNAGNATTAATEEITTEAATDSTETLAADTTAENETTADTEAATEKATEEKNAATSCEVTVKCSNGWESGSKYSCQFDGTITNKSGSDIKDWEIVVNGVNGATISNSWNGNFAISGDELRITGVDYNSTVGAGKTETFGFIIDLDSKDKSTQIENSVTLYVGGEKFSGTLSADNSGNDNSGNDNSNNSGDANTDKTTEATEAVAASEPAKAESGTPFANHGKLSIKGTDVVDKNGNKYQLKGVSTHGIGWFPEYVTEDSFKSLRDDMGANMVRLALYTAEYNGYCEGGNQNELKNLVKKGVDSATNLGMYVIIDWHILHDETPNKYKSDAKAFFEEMSAYYANNDNVLYEICNEPNGSTSWSDVKSYAEEIIPIIRKNAPDAIIIIGTPTWSQDVDIAANDPVTGYENLAYTTHFYAATHKDAIRNKVKTARDKGLCVFVSEFSICDASGNGGIDYNEADAWMKLINDNNISYCAWNLSNKDETSSLIKSSCSKKSGWTDDDLSDSGKWLKKQFLGQ